MISRELKLLIAAIKHTLLKNSASDFKALVNDPNINWARVHKMLEYHRIKPVLYSACKNVGFKNKYVEKLELFSQVQAIKNLNETVESVRVLELLNKNGVQAVPYKGLLFLEKLYQNQALREIGDFDILVRPADGVKALKVLLEDGYVLEVEGDNSEEFLHKIIDTTPSPEVGLIKKTDLGMYVHIDFHWGMNESPFYNIDSNSIFECCEMSDFQNSKLNIPNKIAIFKMLLNHHGARECWVRLKDFADLIAFKNSYPQLDKKTLQNIAAKMNMLKIYNAGESLLEIFFKEGVADIIDLPDSLSLKRIVHMWEYSKLWDFVIPKILLLRIYRKLQDKNTSWLKLIKAQLEFHSKVNLTENKRLFVLPDKYVFLNAFSKLLTYFLRVYIKPMFSK